MDAAPFLPDDIWEFHIFPNLNVRDLASASAVCARWRKMARGAVGARLSAVPHKHAEEIAGQFQRAPLLVTVHGDRGYPSPPSLPPHLHCLFLRDSVSFNDVTILPETSALTLYSLPSLTSLSGVARPPLQKIYVYGCPVADLSPLSSIPEVFLHRCNLVTDLTPLRHAHTLSIRRCNNIATVPSLASVHALEIFDCDWVTDVSPLDGVSVLELHWCRALSDVSPLCGVTHLTLLEIPHLTVMPSLRSVEVLTVMDCDALCDVSALCSARALVIRGCPLITDLTALSKVPILHVDACRGRAACVARGTLPSTHPRATPLPMAWDPPYYKFMEQGPPLQAPPPRGRAPLLTSMVFLVVFSTCVLLGTLYFQGL